MDLFAFQHGWDALMLTLCWPWSYPSSVLASGSNGTRCSQPARCCIQNSDNSMHHYCLQSSVTTNMLVKKIQFVNKFIAVKGAYMQTPYQSLDAADMADVIRAKEGRQPPGKMYSFMKSELLLYSSYRSSGIDMNCIHTYIWFQLVISQWFLAKDEANRCGVCVRAD